MRNSSFVFFAGSLISMAACGGGSSSGGDGPPAETVVTAEDACGHKFAAIVRCDSTLDPDLLGDVRTRFVNNCVQELALAGTGAKPADVEACATAIEAVGCDIPAVSVAACNPKAGTLVDDTACNVNDQCKSTFCSFVQGASLAACGTCQERTELGQHCDPLANECPAGAVCVASAAATTNTTCKALSLLPVDGACNGYEIGCQSGLVCVQYSDSSTKCAARMAPPAACSDDAICDEDSYCDLSAGTCAPLGNEGDACSFDKRCAAKLGCVAASHTCGPLTFAAAGAPCDANIHGSISCQVGTCGQGTGAPSCPGIIDDGKGCLDGSHLTCNTGVDCVAGKCLMSTTSICK